MAFTFRTGVHIPASADWDVTAHPNEVTPASIRTIAWVGSQPDDPAVVQARLQKMKDLTPSKHIVLCVSPINNIFTGITMANWKAQVKALAQTVTAVDVWEIGNEPNAQTSGSLNGVFWNMLREAALIIGQYRPGVPRSLAAPWSNGGIQLFYDNANANFAAQTPPLDIRDYIEAYSIHLYKPTPAVSLSTLQGVRTKVNAYTNSWSNLPVYITEFGWTVHDPKTPPSPQLCPPGTAADTTPGTQAGNLYAAFQNWIAQRQTQKIAAAHWFCWQDVYGLRDGADGYDGVKKNVYAESKSSPPINVAPTPLATSANGYRPAKGALDNLVATTPGGLGVVDPPAVPNPPTVVTVTPPTEITQTSAKLKGTVNPNGQPTTVWIEYGLSASYGFTVPVFGYFVGQGTTVLNVAMAVSGLSPGTTYHYRIKAQSIGGTRYGSDQTFATSEAPLPPTVITGTATEVGRNQADLTGIIDPNEVVVSGGHVITLGPTTILDTTTILGSLVGGGGGPSGTEWWFEYGLTQAYGSTTPPQSVSGGDPVSVTRVVKGLTPGVTYHYRLVGSNDLGITYGLDRTFTTVAPATVYLDGPGTLLPLGLSVEITTRDGRRYRLDANAADPRDRPVATPFSTGEGSGFADATCVVPRPAGLDRADLGLLRKVKFIGADGSTAYEGRIVGTPRSVTEDGEWVEIQFQGVMANSKDRKFMEVYVDRTTARWEAPSLALRKAELGANSPMDSDYTVNTDTGSITFKGSTGKLIPTNSEAVLEYQAPSGVKIAVVQYRGVESNVGGELGAGCRASDDDTIAINSWPENPSMVLQTPPAAGVVASLSFSTPRTYVAVRIRSASGHTPGNVAHRHLEAIALYGSHGLPLRANGNDPAGVFASDVLTDIINRFCPQLDASTIESTDQVIPNLVFDTPTFPYDAFTLINGWHHWLLAAWEDGKVMFEPADLSRTDWQVRTFDPGVTVELQGDNTDNFANGIIVTYQDVDGKETTLWPSDWAQLRDDDPDNPANAEGVELWTELQVTVPVNRAGALTLGAAALADFNRPKSPGTITIKVGYLENGAGHLMPGWMVRYGHVIRITDLPDDEGRLISDTQWDGDGNLTITTEQPPTRMDAVMARLELQQQISRGGS